MSIFISWSGTPSREVAENLSSFVQHVLRVDTFVSVQDIDAGDRWDVQLNSALEPIFGFGDSSGWLPVHRSLSAPRTSSTCSTPVGALGSLGPSRGERNTSPTNG